MKSKLHRRKFIQKCSAAGIAGCALLLSQKLEAYANMADLLEGEEIDPKKLMYCGYVCPEECTFLKGSVENDVKLKKEAYDQWKIKERFNVDFEPEKIFCYGCKNAAKPEGIVLEKCTVRQCVISKELDCCIQCLELVDCDKDLWTRFPDFKKHVIELQKKYLEEQQTNLLKHKKPAKAPKTLT